MSRSAQFNTRAVSYLRQPCLAAALLWLGCAPCPAPGQVFVQPTVHANHLLPAIDFHITPKQKKAACSVNTSIEWCSKRLPSKFSQPTGSVKVLQLFAEYRHPHGCGWHCGWLEPVDRLMHRYAVRADVYKRMCYRIDKTISCGISVWLKSCSRILSIYLCVCLTNILHKLLLHCCFFLVKMKILPQLNYVVFHYKMNIIWIP